MSSPSKISINWTSLEQTESRSLYLLAAQSILHQCTMRPFCKTPGQDRRIQWHMPLLIYLHSSPTLTRFQELACQWKVLQWTQVSVRLLLASEFTWQDERNTWFLKYHRWITCSIVLDKTDYSSGWRTRNALGHEGGEMRWKNFLEIYISRLIVADTMNALPRFLSKPRRRCSFARR